MVFGLIISIITRLFIILLFLSLKRPIFSSSYKLSVTVASAFNTYIFSLTFLKACTLLLMSSSTLVNREVSYRVMNLGNLDFGLLDESQ